MFVNASQAGAMQGHNALCHIVSTRRGQSKMDIEFECTQCGNCCHDLKLPLTLKEAIDWLNDGNAVQVLCEAVPWPVEPATGDLQAAHKRRRSFATASGALPARVVVILAGTFDGACPNLQADKRCGIYARRPLVCRIYPAEINPFLELQPSGKACPPQAWAPDRPPLVRQGLYVDAQLRSCIDRSRESDSGDLRAKEKLCALLQLDAAAMANEGFVVHSPPRAALLAALGRAKDEVGRDAFVSPAPWRFISNRRATVDALASLGALASLMHELKQPSFEYLGFHPATG